MHNADLLNELEPVAAELLDRHLSHSKEWFPHVYVPWERGVKLDFDQDWDPNDFPLSDAARSALFVNLLTEDNLPYYHATIEDALTRNHEALATWNRRWTAEEARHSIVIRDYLTVCDALDPKVLERARMHQMSTAVTPTLASAPDLLAYASLQELATRISHRNTGNHLQDQVGRTLLRRVSMDENLHFLFYRDLLKALMDINPSAAILALERQVRGFEMPGTGITGFKDHAKAIARAEIYDMKIHLEQILEPVIKRDLDIEHVEGLDADAEAARKSLINYMGRLGAIVQRAAARKEEEAQAAAGQ